MKKYSKTSELDIYLNNLLVGSLNKESSGAIAFKYVASWLEQGFEISNSLPLQEDSYRGEVVSRYFDNLLPDNDEIKNIVATKFGAESTRSFDLLKVIGRDCVGALSFIPKGEQLEESFQMHYKELNEAEIARRIRGLSGVTPLGMDENDFRISIAGAQEKTAFLNLEGKWYEPLGLTPTTHIIKTSIGALGSNINFKDSVDNEWASLYIMKEMSLSVCNAKIQSFEDQRVLVVERFDRLWREYKGKQVLLRRPQEDFCQALGRSPYQKYQSEGGPGVVEISKFLESSISLEDRVNFFKAILVFDLLYATDGHAKNFSIFLKSTGFQLTPFYDVMSGYFLTKTENTSIKNLKTAMKIGNSGHYRFDRIAKRHYKETAKQCGINENNFEQIVSELKDSYSALNTSKNKLDPKLNQETLDIILEGMSKRASILF